MMDFETNFEHYVFDIKRVTERTDFALTKEGIVDCQPWRCGTCLFHKMSAESCHYHKFMWGMSKYVEKFKLLRFEYEILKQMKFAKYFSKTGSTDTILITFHFESAGAQDITIGFDKHIDAFSAFRAGEHYDMYYVLNNCEVIEEEK